MERGSGCKRREENGVYIIVYMISDLLLALETFSFLLISLLLYFSLPELTERRLVNLFLHSLPAHEKLSLIFLLHCSKTKDSRIAEDPGHVNTISQQEELCQYPLVVVVYRTKGYFSKTIMKRVKTSETKEDLLVCPHSSLLAEKRRKLCVFVCVCLFVVGREGRKGEGSTSGGEYPSCVLIGSSSLPPSLSLPQTTVPSHTLFLTFSPYCLTSTLLFILPHLYFLPRSITCVLPIYPFLCCWLMLNLSFDFTSQDQTRKLTDEN